jgi:hypothetical protein
MPYPDDTFIKVFDRTDLRMGRHVVHDPRSRAFAVDTPSTVTVTRSFRHKIFGPKPNPNQVVGCCTGVDQCVRADAQGNRVRGQILTMDDAIALYKRATVLDAVPGTFPPDDTGSSGLAAAKAAREAGLIDRYEWIFDKTPDASRVLAALRFYPVGVGTVWTNDMFNPNSRTLLVEPTGEIAGGHQWSIIGYSTRYDAFEGFCWWGADFGANGMFRIRRRHLAELLANDGDAHVTYRHGRNG